MQKKITFMGAGSTVFARNVLGDVMCTPALQDSTIALYDIDEQRLNESLTIIRTLNRNINQDRARIEAYLGVGERKEALRGATFVVNAIQVGGYEPCTVIDFEIPKKYGIQQTIADTLGIGGIMRGLRHRLYEPVYQDQDSRALPQRAGVFRAPSEGSWNGRQVRWTQGTDCRHQSYGLASDDPG